jgi:hypothetical protein
MDATAYSYIAQASQTVVELRVRSTVEVRSSCRINTPLPVLLRCTSTIGVASTCLLAPAREPLSMVHATAETYLFSAGEPVRLKVVHGTGGRRVAWGILQGATETHDSDMEVYTATAGPKSGQVVALHLKNPKRTVSLTAIFKEGNPVPEQGKPFAWTGADNLPVRMLATKVSHQWTAGGWYAIALEGVKYPGLPIPG